MKKIIVLIACITLLNPVFAQKIAVTETGEQVILYDNMTWKYQNEEKRDAAAEIPTNPKKFSKSKQATFLLKSNKLNVGFWLNPEKWKFEKATNNPQAEYELHLKEGDLYAMIISEKLEIPLETLKFAAFKNGKDAAPDLQITKEEYRTVNGLKVLLLQMDGTLQGVKFSYYGYYFSNKKGTVQFITYTSQNLLDDYKTMCEELLNGMVETK